MDSVDDRTIDVSEETARLIREKVQDGSFGSAAEVVEAAMEAMAREEDDLAERAATIKDRIKVSMEDLGPGYSSEEVFGGIKDRLMTRAREEGFHEDPSRPLE